MQVMGGAAGSTLTGMAPRPSGLLRVVLLACPVICADCLVSGAGSDRPVPGRLHVPSLQCSAWPFLLQGPGKAGGAAWLRRLCSSQLRSLGSHVVLAEDGPLKREPRASELSSAGCGSAQGALSPS